MSRTLLVLITIYSAVVLSGLIYVEDELDRMTERNETLCLAERSVKSSNDGLRLAEEINTKLQTMLESFPER